MEITKITLINIKCFEHLEIDLKNGDGAKKWLIILGDNGVGKSTILKSVALGLCEESGAAGLLAEVSDLLRYNTTEGSIRIDLKFHSKSTEEGYVVTTLKRQQYNEVKLTQETYPKDPKTFKWEKLFVCGYGVSRGIMATGSDSDKLFEYAVTDSVYSLFNYSSDLQNPELCLRRIQSEIEIDDILRKLETVLMIEKNSIELKRTGLTIGGPWGQSMPISNLGDGYKTTITWLLDMYGWKHLMEEHLSNLEIEGIIILDELEQHLHPRWQKQIIKLLSDQFPKVQFIVSTHSPLCVIGSTDLMDSDCCITALQRGATSVQARTTNPPRNQRVDQVLTSYLFELYTASDNRIKHDIERYNRLYDKTRTDAENREMEELVEQLSTTLGSSETELEKLVHEATQKTLTNLMDYSIAKLSEKSPANFEIKRQLKNLLE